MKIKFIIAAAVFSISFAQITMAADILVSADEEVNAEPIIQTDDWGGFYLGLQGSYNWIKAGVEGGPDVDGKGIKGGLYTGYNHQFNNDFLLGIEATGNLGGLDETNGGTSIKQEWDTSLRGRMGYAFERSIIYSFAGLGATSIDASTAAGADSNILTGWTAGAGFETVLRDNITARMEYGFSDYSKESFALGGATSTDIDLTDHGLTLGLGIKF